MTTNGVLRWPTERSRKWVEAFLRDAQDDGSIRAVVAIGSAVRAGVASQDVDLLTVTTGPRSSVKAPIEVDVRQYDASDLGATLASGNDLLGWAIRYGVLLLEKDGFWSEFAREHARSVPLPSSSEARGRAAKVQKHVADLLEIGDEEAATEQLISVFTHLARAALIDRQIYPASRPELADQLWQIGEISLAQALENSIFRKLPAAEILSNYQIVHV